MTVATPPADPSLAARSTPWSAIVWWEIRRIPFNIALAVAGLASLAAIYGVFDPLVPPGEDLIEPVPLYLAVGLYAAMANAGYTLGWVSELIWSGGDPARTEPFRARVFYAGLLGSVTLTLAPAAVAGLAWLLIRGS